MRKIECQAQSARKVKNLHRFFGRRPRSCLDPIDASSRCAMRRSRAIAHRAPRCDALDDVLQRASRRASARAARACRRRRRRATPRSVVGDRRVARPARSCRRAASRWALPRIGGGHSARARGSPGRTARAPRRRASARLEHAAVAIARDRIAGFEGERRSSAARRAAEVVLLELSPAVERQAIAPRHAARPARGAGDLPPARGRRADRAGGAERRADGTPPSRRRARRADRAPRRAAGTPAPATSTAPPASSRRPARSCSIASIGLGERVEQPRDAEPGANLGERRRVDASARAPRPAACATSRGWRVMSCSYASWISRDLRQEQRIRRVALLQVAQQLQARARVCCSYQR